MKTKTRQNFRSVEFISDEGGNAIMLFGLTFMPVMLMLGATVDYTRYTTTRAALQQATDAAVLTVASKITETTTDAQALAQAQVVLNAVPRMGAATVLSATISEDKQTVCATSQVTIQNSFMQIAQLASLTPTVKSCANLAGGVDPAMTYEIALVLDNSGSMSSSAGGVSKMQALKDAATSFVNTMYAKTSNLKMSVTPFAAGVVALDPNDADSRNKAWIDTKGDNSQHWVTFGGKSNATAQGFASRFDIFDKLKTLKSSWDWGGCLEQPKYPLNVNDTTPNPSDPETLFVPYLAPDEPNDDDYSNHYLSDGGVAGGACSGSVSGDWNRLTRTCKYKTPSKAGYGVGPNSHCPSASTQTLLQLTPTKTTVTTKIGQLREGGYTNLHEGFMWGWRTLSPSQPFAGGRSYSAPKNRKIIVFMTDGFNNWKSQTNTATGSTYQALGYYSYNGQKNERFPDGSQGSGVDYQSQLKAANNTWSDYHDTSRNMQDQLTLEACTNAKAAGIEVFTIGFSTPGDPIDAQGLTLMQNCATNPEHYFRASDAAQLNAAFSSIGVGLGKLRLSM